MDDLEAAELLHRLHRYVQEYKPDLPQTIPALADDLAMSFDAPTPTMIRYLREIQEAYND